AQLLQRPAGLDNFWLSGLMTTRHQDPPGPAFPGMTPHHHHHNNNSHNGNNNNRPSSTGGLERGSHLPILPAGLQFPAGVPPFPRRSLDHQHQSEPQDLRMMRAAMALAQQMSGARAAGGSSTFNTK